MAGREVDWEEVQGLVLSGYPDKSFSHYFLLTIMKPLETREWLGNALKADEISFGFDHYNKDTRPKTRLNVAFTLSGLKTLGLPDADLATFPWDFRDGMVSNLRQALLGDRNHNDWSHWEWGYPDGTKAPNGGALPHSHGESQIHMLVILHAESEEDRAAKVAELRSNNAFAEIQRSTAEGYFQPDNRREHFGFLDGISQPAVEASPRAEKLRERGEFEGIVQPGEFVLGYANERGQLPVSPSLAVIPGADLPVITNADRSVSGHPPQATFPRLDFGSNGTFLVYRQLAQHVHAFARTIADGAARLGDGNTPRLSDEADFTRTIAAKLVGRWDNGTSLTLAPQSPPPHGSGLAQVNNFGYADEDKDGLRCPIGSHVRRTNPRDSLGDDADGSVHRVNRHRIIRRGRLYGKRTKWLPWEWSANTHGHSDGVDRGIHFLAINASIESQFEFIQQTWMSTPFFGDLTNEFDPFASGSACPGTEQRFTIQGTPINRRIYLNDPLVTVRGGAYFFVPGRAALKFLADENLVRALQPRPNSLGKSSP